MLKETSVEFQVLNSRIYEKCLTRDITPHSLAYTHISEEHSAPLFRAFFNKSVLAGSLLELLLIPEYGNDMLM
jgi:hypothetical protein